MILRWPRPIALALLCLTLLTACVDKSEVRPEDDPLGLSPDNSPAEIYVRMAEQYYARGQMEIAFRRARQAITADGRYPRAHVWMAFLYEQLSQDALAAEHYARAVALAPKNPDVLHAYGSYLCREERYADADAHFQRALDNPLYATPWVTMTNAGDCARKAGDVSKAEAYYRSAVAANPNFGPALVKRAALTYARGEIEAAKGDIDRYFGPETLRTAASSREALQLGVRIERQLGNHQRADFYQQALRERFSDAAAAREPQGVQLDERDQITES
ncbi:type IV pilus biogenesis/stability protein PilW [Marichromatium bheemlicum]|uniref:Type IV pilus biogenesis/stability protein PilW n=1 Tax=Marichromatium bheemlicum TaxID=365339 RepID=A0ABX1I357_9GAMM|nr:type IV pilus biogenesis/stability protein PilW [Marichromatium bheemlicum]NKN31884.1 type IV pilus biogenesis/stability protein PilW [Marichromatium bheemlicum]